jgi:hypothetical protein
LTVWLVGFRGVQICLRVKSATPVEQAVGAPLRPRQTGLENLEDGRILVIWFHKFCVSKLLKMLNSVF